MTTLGENKDLVRQYYYGTFEEILDLDATADIAKNILMHEPLEGDIRGREAFIEYYRQLAKGLSDSHIGTDGLLAEGDQVAVRWSVTGTHDSEFFGIKATGTEFTMSGVDIVRVENGKIAEIWSYYDTLGMMHQLGVIEMDVELPLEA